MRDERDPPPYDSNPYEDRAPAAGPQEEEGSGLPSNVEAEQALLGCILIHNDMLSAVPQVRPEHFHDPVHGRVFAACQRAIEEGRVADPTLLKHLLRDDAGLIELGGARYLARLAHATITPRAAPDYAREIVALAQRRTVIVAADALRAAAASSEDLEGALGRFDGEALAVLEQAQARPRTQSFLAVAVGAIDRANAAYQGELPPAIRSDLPTLDRNVSLYPGDLCILGARPSIGKTSLAGSLARRYAAAGHPVFFASGEMSPEAIMFRMLCELASDRGVVLPYRDAMSGQIDEQQFRAFVEAARANERLPLTIHDARGRRAGAVIAETRRWLRRTRAEQRDQDHPKAPVVLVDYLQLLAEAQAGRSRNDEVSAASMAFKALAGGEEALVICLAQLSRGVESREDKRPKLADLRDSGSIEQDADAALFLYRDDYYAEREKPSETDVEATVKWQDRMELSRGRMEVICAKQRNGPVGITEIRCNLATNTFWEDGRL